MIAGLVTVILGWTWGEDFESTPIGTLTPGWVTVSSQNANPWRVENDCYQWYQPSPPSQILCTDGNWSSSVQLVSEVRTPSILLPSGHGGAFTLSYDWTVVSGTLQIHIREFINSSWSTPILVDQTVADSAGDMGTAVLSLQISPYAESIRIHLRYASAPSPYGWPGPMTGASVDNVLLQDSLGLCCHLTFDSTTLDSVVWDSLGAVGHFVANVCFADSTCGLPVDTFEIEYLFNGAVVDRDTIVLSLNSCTTVSFSGYLQNGINTIEVIDNDCCTSPHVIWQGVDVDEATYPEHRPRIRVWVWGDYPTPGTRALPVPAKVYTPTGRVLIIRNTHEWSRLPSGRYVLEFRQDDRLERILLLRLP